MCIVICDLEHLDVVKTIVFILIKIEKSYRSVDALCPT